MGAACAAEKSWFQFERPRGVYQIPLVRSELVCINAYPLDIVRELSEMASIYRVTVVNEWVRTFSYQIYSTDRGFAINRSELVSEPYGIRLKYISISKDQFGEIVQAIDKFQSVVAIRSKGEEDKSEKPSGKKDPIVVVERLAAHGAYQGSLVLPRGYDAVSQQFDAVTTIIERVLAARERSPE